MVPTSAFTSAQRLTLVASPWSQQWLVFRARFQIRHVHHRANICAAALSCHASVVRRVLLSASKYQNLAHDSCWFSCVSMQSSFWFPLWGLCMCLFGRKMSHVAQASMKLMMEARLSLDSYCTLSNCQNHRCRGICGAFLFPSPSPPHLYPLAGKGSNWNHTLQTFNAKMLSAYRAPFPVLWKRCTFWSS